ncbi:uncharacterized protein TNCT_697071 [Trichonephila clavata]|uniref:Gustatory receptor n=1 Tax=Trichonephila clavata TaxID=2740835 RepID=A0A8X6FMS3_TRICU|nr:uncharacterized protein TNCT_697071 [Trichonephila clavata]
MEEMPICKKIKSILKLLTEMIIVVLTSYTIYLSLTSGIEFKTTYAVTTILINSLLLLLRIALLLKKNEVLKTLSKLSAFRNGLQNKSQIPLRKYAILASCLTLLLPLVMVISSTVELLINIDKFSSIYLHADQNSTWDRKLCLALFMASFSTVYMMHYIAFPGLVIVLLSFVYLTFVKTFQQHLEAMRLRLLERFSKDEISKSLAIFTAVKNIHLNIEKSMQLFSFLAYVLIFSNILQMISGIVTSFMSNKGMGNFIITSTTLGFIIIWFIALTLCGAQVEKTEVFLRNMSQDIITKNFGDEIDGHKNLVYMNLFNACADFELRFTGCGMFVVDKKLFLPVTGIMVTYGVLFATEVSKI